MLHAVFLVMDGGGGSTSLLTNLAQPHDPWFDKLARTSSFMTSLGECSRLRHDRYSTTTRIEFSGDRLRASY